VDQAAAVYKTFERKEPALRAAAATNLSFLYLLEGDLAAAAKYTDLALKTDRYKWRRQPNRTLTAAVAPCDLALHECAEVIIAQCADLLVDSWHCRLLH
jgi:hypothetical protein